MIVERCGWNYNPKNAVEKAKLYCEKCIKLGGKWCWFNPMTEEVEYYFLKKKCMSRMDESWKMYEEHVQHG